MADFDTLAAQIYRNTETSVLRDFKRQRFADEEVAVFLNEAFRARPQESALLEDESAEDSEEPAPIVEETEVPLDYSSPLAYDVGDFLYLNGCAGHDITETLPTRVLDTLDVSCSPELTRNGLSFAFRRMLPKSSVKNLIMCGMETNMGRVGREKEREGVEEPQREEFKDFQGCPSCIRLSHCHCVAFLKCDDTFYQLLRGACGLARLTHLDVRRNYLCKDSVNALVYLVRHSRSLVSIGVSVGRQRSSDLTRQLDLLSNIAHNTSIRALRLFMYNTQVPFRAFTDLLGHFDTIGLSGAMHEDAFQAFRKKATNKSLELLEIVDLHMRGCYYKCTKSYFDAPCSKYLLFNLTEVPNVTCDTFPKHLCTVNDLDKSFYHSLVEEKESCPLKIATGAPFRSVTVCKSTPIVNWVKRSQVSLFRPYLKTTRR